MAVILVGCSSPSTPQITPIDSELNHRLLTGEGLDTRLFSTSQTVQYYEVAHLDALAPEAAQTALDRFIRRQYRRADLTRLREFTVLFYHPTFLVDYRAEAYEAARDTEVGFLTEHHDALAAQVRLVELPGPGQRWRRSRVLYHAQAVQRSVTDTVHTDQLLHR
ncbi:hypothetical protein I2H31_09460 [Hymenobacter sp. BT662]|uniref:DUF4136 domain-containing protein n=2 Tax=Hymenobacter ruricola TaxID=2791023 RepID=A0ABS0I345_9BACT|nr:hypothetical protein [Hymenobacter ruricola]